MMLCRMTCPGARVIFLLALFALAWPLPAEELPDIESVKPDLAIPPLETGQPAAGKRVRQVLPAYRETSVYHSVYLPTDWQPGKRYPVIVHLDTGMKRLGLDMREINQVALDSRVMSGLEIAYLDGRQRAFGTLDQRARPGTWNYVAFLPFFDDAAGSLTLLEGAGHRRSGPRRGQPRAHTDGVLGQGHRGRQAQP